MTRDDCMIPPSSQAVFQNVPRGWVAELPAISSRFLFPFYIAIFIASGYDCYIAMVKPCPIEIDGLAFLIAW